MLHWQPALSWKQLSYLQQQNLECRWKWNSSLEQNYSFSMRLGQLEISYLITCTKYQTSLSSNCIKTSYYEAINILFAEAWLVGLWVTNWKSKILRTQEKKKNTQDHGYMFF